MKTNRGRRADFGRRVLGKPARIDQELLQIGRVGVEGQGAAGRQAQHHERLFRVFQDQLHGAGFRGVLGLGRLMGLVQTATQPEDDDRQARADEEGNAPAPRGQRRLTQRILQHDQQQQGDQLTRDQGDVLEAGPEASAMRLGHFGQIGGAGSVFSADAEALQQPREQQQRRRRQSDGGIAGCHADDQRTRAHQGHREGQPRLATFAVGIDPHDPCPDGPHQEAHRKDGGGAQQLRRRVFAGEEDGREI